MKANISLVTIAWNERRENGLFEVMVLVWMVCEELARHWMENRV